jgi:hypothetical protein
MATLKQHGLYSMGRSTSNREPRSGNSTSTTRTKHAGTRNQNNFEQGFKHWNEATSTSPSRQHLGHYKAILALRHLEPDKDEDGNPIETTSQLILEAITEVTSLAIRKGLILDQWLNVSNVMIEKIPGKPLLNKL